MPALNDASIVKMLCDNKIFPLLYFICSGSWWWLYRLCCHSLVSGPRAPCRRHPVWAPGRHLGGWMCLRRTYHKQAPVAGGVRRWPVVPDTADSRCVILQHPQNAYYQAFFNFLFFSKFNIKYYIVCGQTPWGLRQSKEKIVVDHFYLLALKDNLRVVQRSMGQWK